MENKFLTQFLQMRQGLANAEEKTKKSNEKVKPIPEPMTFSSLQTIIEERPDRKKVIEYFERRRDELNEEYGN